MAETRHTRGQRSRSHIGVLTAVALAVVGVSAPLLIDVYGQIGNALRLPPHWLAAIALAEACQLVAVWYVLRVLLRSTRWFDVAASQLAGDAASNLVPGATLAGAGLQVSMLLRAGFSATRVTTSLAALSIVTAIPAFIVLPLLVLIATAVGSTVEPRLVGPMWLLVAALSSVLLGLVLVVRLDKPWLMVAVVVSAIRRALRRSHDAEDLGRRLLRERDEMDAVMRERAGTLTIVAVGRTMGDFLALYLALHAVGADISAVTTMVVFIVGDIAGRIPLTPGGFGIVEAGLAGALSIAGVANEPALVALVTYRLAATWLPSAAGLIALVLFERRHGRRRSLVPGR